MGRKVGDRFGYSWDERSDLADTLGALTRKAEELQGRETAAVTPAEAFSAAVLAETLARKMAEHPGGYRNYAVNPEGLAELAEAVSAMQRAARILAKATHPAAAAEAINVAFFSGAADAPML